MSIDDGMCRSYATCELRRQLAIALGLFTEQVELVLLIAIKGKELNIN